MAAKKPAKKTSQKSKSSAPGQDQMWSNDRNKKYSAPKNNVADIKGPSYGSMRQKAGEDARKRASKLGKPVGSTKVDLANPGRSFLLGTYVNEPIVARTRVRTPKGNATVVETKVIRAGRPDSKRKTKVVYDRGRGGSKKSK